MVPTLLGILTLLLCGPLLVRGTLLSMLIATMFLSLLGGSAAIILPALGNSSVQPAILALGFLALKCLMPGPQRTLLFEQSVRAQRFLILFVVYGIGSALLLPRLFAGLIYVTPLRPIPGRFLYTVLPLGFSAQNITVSVYLVATLIAAIAGYMAAGQPRAHERIARTASVIALVHAFLGLTSVLFANTFWTTILGWFRNGSYAQLNQAFDGLVRMNGIWPEPATYASFGFVWLVFTTELWLRDIDTRWSGKAALLIGVALLASTSSTAIIGLGAYSLILIVRLALAPRHFEFSKIAIVALNLSVALVALLMLFAFDQTLLDRAITLAEQIIFNKAQSESGLQRAFWAKQGIDAFAFSWGIGIGAGSFRSSSLITAILGSMGVVGMISFLGHLYLVHQPLRRSSYARVRDPRVATGVAAGWATLLPLVPASVAAASPDPGFVWALLGAFALALRAPATQPVSVPIRGERANRHHNVTALGKGAGVPNHAT